MKEKVYYTTTYKYVDEIGKIEKDCVILVGSDNWDDYGYKTTLHVYMFKNGEKYSDGNWGYIRKLLFKNQREGEYTYSKLDKLCQNQIYIKFIDIYEKYNYISLGYEYEVLKKLYPENFDEILEVLNDVVYLERNKPESKNLLLKNHKGFEISLCRDQNAKKLLEEVKSMLYGDILDSNRFKFNFHYVLNNREYKFNLNFVKQDLPHRVNIVIGKNGVGKTKFLEILNKYFLYQSPKNKENINNYNIKVDKRPNFISNIIAISFSVYEEFELDNKEYDVKNYKYIGYRNNENKIEPHNLEIKAYNSLKKIYERDLNNFSKKIKIYEKSYLSRIIKILSNAFECKYIGLKQNENNIIFLDEKLFYKHIKKIDFNKFEKKLYFFDKDKRLINLSAGQKTFANLIVNIIGSIRNNSLLLIDEPENTLHPNFEIDFMNILFDILEEFDSFSIIATHSAIITREVPREYVNIIKINSENDIVIMNPSIQTFGANIMDINNLVFDDVFKENKPFEKWLKKQCEKYSNFNEFYNNYMKILSYDFLLEAKRLWSIWDDKN